MQLEGLQKERPGALVFSLEVGDMAKVRQRFRFGGAIADLLPDRQSLFEQLLRCRIITLRISHVPRAMKRQGTLGSWSRRGIRAKQLGVPPSGLEVMATCGPELAERARQP